jgi:hypothetical protein
MCSSLPVDRGALLPLTGTFDAAVAAAVDQHVWNPVLAAGEDHRLGPDRGSLVVTGLRYLTVMADVDPGTHEDALHLGLEDLWIDVDVPVDTCVLHQ